MLATLNRAEVVVFDRIDENAVFANHAQLDNVVSELRPL
jgi:hypothetical protein